MGSRPRRRRPRRSSPRSTPRGNSRCRASAGAAWPMRRQAAGGDGALRSRSCRPGPDGCVAPSLGRRRADPRAPATSRAWVRSWSACCSSDEAGLVRRWDRSRLLGVGLVPGAEARSTACLLRRAERRGGGRPVRPDEYHCGRAQAPGLGQHLRSARAGDVAGAQASGHQGRSRSSRRLPGHAGGAGDGSGAGGARDHEGRAPHGG